MPKGSLTRDPKVSEHVKVICADFASGDNQVHGINFELLTEIVHECRKLDEQTATLLEAAFTLAWFALLRPTEDMLTPGHPVFDQSRHLRAGDITFWHKGKRTTPGQGPEPDSIKANIKQSKTDSLRLGAEISIGRTHKSVCKSQVCKEER